ncbi:MAG: threonylcarbamoyl-AMP synthase [Hymenobacter sp.]|nr:MAG: threonylcarbamoyl-AMP synthase [Hymenobacter sp.]
MPETNFTNDIEHCLTALQSGGVILFPTNTIWGLGCDATNEAAVNKVLQIKQRHAAQGLITLLADAAEIEKYADALPVEVIEEIAQKQNPTTIIYRGAKNVAANVIPEDRTIAIRIVKDTFCQQLIQVFGKPIVSTSANIHGQPSPQNFAEINSTVISQVDYVVQYRQQEQNLFQPSTILKIRPDGFETIRP